jgi:hypothetical protein
LVYRTDRNGYGDHYTKIEYKVVTDDGAVSSNSAFMDMRVERVVDPPVGSNIHITMNEDATFTFKKRMFKAESVETGEFTGIKIYDEPSRGDLYLRGKHLERFDVIKPEDISKMTYVPDKDGFGDNYSAFRFDVMDGVGEATYKARISVREKTDTFNGTNHGEWLYGIKGSNILFGRGGADDFKADKYDDVYIGGTGGDMFFFVRNGGRDTVRDFDVKHDIINVEALRGVNGFSSLRHHLTQDGHDVVIHQDSIHDQDDVMILKHTTISEVQSSSIFY